MKPRISGSHNPHGSAPRYRTLNGGRGAGATSLTAVSPPRGRETGEPGGRHRPFCRPRSQRSNRGAPKSPRLSGVCTALVAGGDELHGAATRRSANTEAHSGSGTPVPGVEPLFSEARPGRAAPPRQRDRILRRRCPFRFRSGQSVPGSASWTSKFPRLLAAQDLVDPRLLHQKAPHRAQQESGPCWGATTSPDATCLVTISARGETVSPPHVVTASIVRMAIVGSLRSSETPSESSRLLGGRRRNRRPNVRPG